MKIKRRILCSLILSLVMVMQSQIILAQTPSLSTTVYADKTRFESQEENTEFRVEVFNSSGQKMFDSGFVAGQTLDWNMRDQQGEPVADGVYECFVTVKNRHGRERATQSGQLAIFRDGQDLEKAPTLVQAAAAPGAGGGSGNVTGSGTAGQLTKWTGATSLGNSVITESNGSIGIGTTSPFSQLHIIGPHPATSTLAGTNATEGLRLSGGKGGDTSGSGQTAGIGANVVLQAGDGGDALAGTSGRGGFVTIQPGAPGVGALNGAFGQVILAPGGGNVGIGITNAGSKLTVAGMIETTLGGLKFPDGTLQTTAATSGLASIFHDTTLTGNGTNGSPLGVSNNGVGTNQLADNAVTATKIAASQVVKSLNGLFDNVSLAAGSNITITPSGNTLTIATNSAAGSVTHDVTLTGNGTSGSPLGISVPLSLTVSSVGPVIEATAIQGSAIRGVSTVSGAIGVYGQVGGGSGALEVELSGAGVAGNGSGYGVIGSGAIAGVSGLSRDGGTGVEGSGGGGDALHHAGVGVQGGGGGSSAQSAGGEDTSGGTGVQGNGGQHDTRGGDGVVGIGGDAPNAPGTVGGTGVVGKGGNGAGGIINGLAGFFDGDVVVDGDLSSDSLHVSGTKNFKIDHPLDPANKYLYHAAIESSEVMNLYTGKITLDANGEAVVQMPDWFEALNKDFRYSLTPIGAPGPNLYIAEEVSGNRFKIAGGAAGMKVSWQVTGVRQDAYMRAHPMKVEVEKSEKERGHYLRPELFDQPEEKSIDWARDPELMKRMKEQRETAKQKLENKNR
jgi:hypothetical protein